MQCARAKHSRLVERSAAGAQVGGGGAFKAAVEALFDGQLATHAVSESAALGASLEKRACVV